MGETKTIQTKKRKRLIINLKVLVVPITPISPAYAKA